MEVGVYSHNTTQWSCSTGGYSRTEKGMLFAPDSIAALGVAAEDPVAYSLYRCFHHWSATRVNSRPPAGLVVRPIRSADEQWPLGALLPAIITILRSRLARLERVQSLRRWYLLYASHNTVLPTESSQLSCLSKARRSCVEYCFYERLSYQVIVVAANELLRARLVHGIRQWRLAVVEINHQLEWGGASVRRRLFTVWARASRESSLVRSTALWRAIEWLASGGARASRAHALRRLRTDASIAVAQRRVLVAMTQRAIGRVWRGWRKHSAQWRARRAATRTFLHASLSARAEDAFARWSLMARGMASWLECATEADGHAVRMACARLRRGWQVWNATHMVISSLRRLRECACLRLNGALAWRRWHRFLGQEARARMLGERALLALANRALGAARVALRCWHARTHGVWQRLIRAAATESGHLPTMRAGLHRWQRHVRARRAAHRAVCQMRHLRSGAAWRTWVAWRVERRAALRMRARLLERSLHAHVRGLTSSITSVLEHWRALAFDCRLAGRRRHLGRRAVSHMRLRDSAHCFHALSAHARRRLVELQLYRSAEAVRLQCGLGTRSWPEPRRYWHHQ